ncbi:MAG: TatD family hydrolase [Geothrix sp.]|nr:TatD family hydrolase [Geothrix sp.]
MPARFDAHSHLPDSHSAPSDHRRVVCGTCESDWEAILAHAASDDQVLPMLGLHPWFVTGASPEWAPRLESLLHSHQTGVGECGLDFARKETDQPSQEAAFRAQLRLAHALHRPVAMHVVRAWGRLLDILRTEGVPPAGAMVHAYAGSPGTAQTLQSMGVFLSFSGDLLKPERTKLRESLRSVDASHLLLETDGTADLVHVVELAATLRGVSAAVLAAQTCENGQRCFKELIG